MTTYRERRLARAERLRDWAEKRKTKAEANFKTANRIADGIPFGQPILVGHHSERHHRSDLDKIHNNMRNGIDNENKANDMASRADNIEAAADSAIYNDDPDAIDRLKERITSLEAERDRIKAINDYVRKNKPIEPPLTDDEKRRLINHAQFGFTGGKPGFSSYVLTNLGADIRRNKERLKMLENRKANPETTYRIIEAKFQSLCRKCKLPMMKKSYIKYFPELKEAEHQTCPQPSGEAGVIINES